MVLHYGYIIKKSFMEKMTTVFTPEQWSKIALDIYTITDAELLAARDKVSKDEYARLKVMCDFFSYLRGDKMLQLRPGGTGVYMKTFYKMENDLYSKLGKLSLEQ